MNLRFDWDWAFAWEILPRLLEGAWITLQATVVGFVLALVIGLLLALGRRGPRLVSIPTTVFIEFVRSTPLLVQLYVLYFILPNFGISMSAFLTGVIGLGNIATQTGAGSPRTYPALTLSQGSGWVVGVSFYEFTDTSQSAPTGMTERGQSAYLQGSTIISDTNGDVSSWSATSVSDLGSGDWLCITMEITT